MSLGPLQVMIVNWEWVDEAQVAELGVALPSS
jgi:hypothetical protein